MSPSPVDTRLCMYKKCGYFKRRSHQNGSREPNYYIRLTAHIQLHFWKISTESIKNPIWMLTRMLTHRFKWWHYYYSNLVGVDPPPGKMSGAHVYPSFFGNYLYVMKEGRGLGTQSGIFANCALLILSRNQRVRTICARNTKKMKKIAKSHKMSCLTRIAFGGLIHAAAPVSHIETACDSLRNQRK